MMTRALLIGIAALFLATGTAHAGNCRNYQCGEVKVQACLYKEDGKVAGEEVAIQIPNNFNNKIGREQWTSGTFLYNGIEEPIAYFIKGKRYKCKGTDFP
jgi:hypothetical protein